MMKTNFSVLVSAHVSKTFLIPCLTVMALLLLPMATANAQDKVSSALDAVAILDMQQLLAESKAAQSIRSQIEKQRNGFQSKVEKKTNDLKSSEAELIKQQGVLSKEDFLKKRKEFDQSVLEAKQSVNQLTYNLGKANAEAMNTLRDKIVNIAAQVASEKGVSMVLSRDQVVVFEKHMDITPMVLEELNKTVTSIPVKVSK